MILDWHIVVAILKLIVPAGVGAMIERLLQRRSKLICYYSSIATHTIDAQPPIQVHTCSIVIRNDGRAAAHNVVIPHLLHMMNVHVLPPVPYQLNPLPGGAEELVFPLIIPKQEISISYLYYPPLVLNQIHSRPRSDEGFAKFVPMNLTRNLSRAKRTAILIVFTAGLLAILYLLIAGGMWAYEQLPASWPTTAQGSAATPASTTPKAHH